MHITHIVAVHTQVLQLLAEHLAQWSCSVAFPELGHLTSVQLRALAKALPAERFRTQVRIAIMCCARLPQSGQVIDRQRRSLGLRPQ